MGSPTRKICAAINIKPLYDRVVIKRTEEEKVSAGGIVIPDSATEKPIKGRVVAVGEGKVFDNGNVRAPKVKVGDQSCSASTPAPRSSSTAPSTWW